MARPSLEPISRATLPEFARFLQAHMPARRDEQEWPLARTEWARYHLAPDRALTSEAPGSGEVRYETTGPGVTFKTAPFREATEITGPMAAKLFVSSETTDADLFLVVRLFDPDDQEVTFMGALDPNTPLAQGWLRASHRKLDKKLSTPYRPYHTHDRRRPLKPGEVVEVDIEIWPTCVVLPAGYRIGVTIRGKDYEYPGSSGGRLSNFKNELLGCGPFLHDDPRDRPAAVFGGKVTLHFGPQHPSYILLPVIPAKA